MVNRASLVTDVSETSKVLKQLIVLRALKGETQVGSDKLQRTIASMEEVLKNNCIMFLEGQAVQLAGLPIGEAQLAMDRVAELISDISTLEPNAGANQSSSLQIETSSHGDVDVSLVPKLSNFSGRVEDGFRFLEDFKIKTHNMREVSRIATFKALCGVNVVSWFKSRNFESWSDLEKGFLDSWCVKLTPSDAIAKAAQLVHRDNGYLREYIVQFEELKRFFEEDVTVKMMIDMFMRNVRPSLRKYYREIKRSEHSWSQFLQVISDYDEEETRWEGVSGKVSEKASSSQAVVNREISKSSVQKEPKSGSMEEKLIRIQEENAELRKALKDIQVGSFKTEPGKPKRDRKDIKCFHCQNLGHYKNECPTNPDRKRGKNSDNDGKSSGKGSQK